MALKLVLDKLDDVPEALRTEYTEKDGKFHLNVDGIEDTTPLKKAIDAERKSRAALETKIKSWEKLGKTPDEIEALVTQVTKDEEEKLTRAGDWDKLKAQMNARYESDMKAVQAKLDAKDGEIKSMRGSLESHLVDAQATAAIAAEKGIPDLLLPHVRNFIRVIEKDGKFSTQIVDSAGSPRVNGKGDPLGLNELVAELKSTEVHGRAFEGSGNSGSGARPGGGGGAATSIKRRGELKTEKERAAFIDEHGLDLYQSLPM